MTKRRLLDTNLIIRHLVQDNAAQAKLAGKLFEACDRGEINLTILSAVVAEAVFVLESFYNHPAYNIARVVGLLLASPGIELVDDEIHQAALIEYAKGGQHFVDCLIVAYARNNHWTEATFDQGIRKLPGVKVELA